MAVSKINWLRRDIKICILDTDGSISQKLLYKGIVSEIKMD